MLLDESKAVVTALRNIVLPRLDQRDASVFAKIVKDLWPHVTLDDTTREMTRQPEVDDQSVGGSSQGSRIKPTYGHMTYSQPKSFRGMSQHVNTDD